jgi:hypothetical protein
MSSSVSSGNSWSRGRKLNHWFTLTGSGDKRCKAGAKQLPKPLSRWRNVLVSGLLPSRYERNFLASHGICHGSQVDLL